MIHILYACTGCHVWPLQWPLNGWVKCINTYRTFRERSLTNVQPHLTIKAHSGSFLLVNLSRQMGIWVTPHLYWLIISYYLKCLMHYQGKTPLYIFFGRLLNSMSCPAVWYIPQVKFLNLILGTPIINSKSNSTHTYIYRSMLCNRIWHLLGNPKLVWEPTRLRKERGYVDLSMDTMHLNDPLTIFGSECSSLTPPLFLLSPRIIMLC